jgi:UDP-N-acetylglucosamine 2-epimerase (non-hydrolysing)
MPPEGRRPVSLHFVVGARPNFVKAAPLLRACDDRVEFTRKLIHTGQHYDRSLSDAFFADLDLPAPDIHLGVGSGSHASQTGQVMGRLEPILEDDRPDWLLVFGDVNSTLAASLTAAKLGIAIAHVEAGLRSFDPSMPEEINRRVTDCLSDLLFTTEESGNRNLEREGTAPEKVHFVGNTMVDSLNQHLEAARAGRPEVLRRLGLTAQRYAVMTLHRPANVDAPRVLERILGAVGKLSARLPVVFPLHPRTRQRLEDGSLRAIDPGVALCPALPYLEFLGLMDGASLVLTDSGGIQEETTALGVPCLTLRSNTERPVTLTHGSNRLVGDDPQQILAAAESALDPSAPRRSASLPPLWDGQAARRIARVLARATATGKVAAQP